MASADIFSPMSGHQRKRSVFNNMTNRELKIRVTLCTIVIKILQTANLLATFSHIITLKFTPILEEINACAQISALLLIQV